MKQRPSTTSILTACKPRKEVLEGELDDAIFAADFGQLIDGSAPKVYGHAETFFRNTEPTPDLKSVCGAVFKALADKKEAGHLIRLSTGFGGGKTHTLMALWHLAKNIAKLSLGTELLPAAGRPKTVKVVAVDAAKAGIPIFGTHGPAKTHSLQGEIILQLGGAAALNALGAADHHEASPDQSAIVKALGDEPLLILLDELVIYKAGQSLDPDRFLKTILSGTTPIPDQPDVFRLSDLHERFLAALGPLAYSTGASLLRSAVRGAAVTKFVPGPFYPLDEDSGARVACYALVATPFRECPPCQARQLESARGGPHACGAELGFDRPARSA